MGHQMIRSMLMLCLCLVMAQAQAASVNMDNMFVEDSDGMWQYRVLVGVDENIDQPLAGGSAGIRLGRWHVRDSAGSEDFDVLKLHYDSGETRPWRARLGAMQLSGEGSPTLGDALVTWQGGPWYVEAGAQRELVDTVSAIRLHYLVDTWSLSTDYRLNPQWTVVGALYTQSINDGNRRLGQVARLIYSPAALEGFTVQARLRHVDSDFNGIGYFSPDRQLEYLLQSGYRRPVLGDHWVVGGQIGAGRQEINRDISNPYYYGELSLRGWFTDRFGLDSRLVCTTAGGNALGQGASGYRYCIANLSLTGVW